MDDSAEGGVAFCESGVSAVRAWFASREPQLVRPYGGADSQLEVPCAVDEVLRPRTHLGVSANQRTARRKTAVVSGRIDDDDRAQDGRAADHADAVPARRRSGGDPRLVRRPRHAPGLVSQPQGKSQGARADSPRTPRHDRARRHRRGARQVLAAARPHLLPYRVTKRPRTERSRWWSASVKPRTPEPAAWLWRASRPPRGRVPPGPTGRPCRPVARAPSPLPPGSGRPPLRTPRR